MATTLGTYVFKLHFDDGPIHTTRRYGYTGSLQLPQVFAGLYERSAQVFNLAPHSFTLALRDAVGQPTILLDSYARFREHVCAPLIASPEHVKIDEKGRRVLVFLIQRKSLSAAPATTMATTSALASTSASTPTVQGPSKPITCSLPLRPAPAPSVSMEASTSTSLDPSLLSSPTGSLNEQSPPQQFKSKVSGTTSDTAVDAADTVEMNGSRCCAKPAQPQSGSPARSGYNPVYTSSSSTPAVLPTSGSSTTAATDVPGDSVKPAVAKKQEAWPTVRTMLETFVKDLNVHLADTFGDEAGAFRLNAAEEEDKVKEGMEGQAKKDKGKAKEEVKAEVETPKPVHAHVFCDRCLKTISGSRFKCKGCTNYDLCEFCVDFRAEFHQGSHEFVEIARPGAAPLASTRGAIVIEVPKPVVVPTPVTVEAVHNPPPAVHTATCDGCQDTIIGTRHKCLDCPDYDLCFECHSSAAAVHPDHRFVTINDPRDLVWRRLAVENVIHRHVRCDGCNKSPIRGVRYKCMHPDCPDFDLCASCEADPIARHPRTHNLLKMRVPATTLFGSSPDLRAQVGRAQGYTCSRPVVSPPSVASGSTPARPVEPVHPTPAHPLAAFLQSVGASVASQVAAASSAAAPVVAHEDKDQEKADVEEKVEAPIVETEVNEMKEVPKNGSSPVRVQVEEASTATESESESESDEEAVAAAKVHVDRLGCSFVADVTLSDGAIVPSGSEFTKVWSVRNTGTLAWPASCRLVHVGGFGAMKNHEGFDVPEAAPGEVVEAHCECKAPEDEGRFMSFFRLAEANGAKFGDRFWVDITVESDGALHNSGSLSSSSIITPSLSVNGKASSVPASEHGKTVSSAAPSTTFSLSEVESDFESVERATASHFSSRAVSEVADDDETDDNDASGSSDEESSELEESEDEFVVLSDEGDAWRD